MTKTPKNIFGVVDALSSYQVGGPLSPAALVNAADGATSGASSDKLQDWLRDVLIDNNSVSGIRVNAKTAMQYAPVHYGISKVAGHLSVMSESLKERIGDRKTKAARRHQAHRLIKYPNDLYTGSVFKDALFGHAIFRGNGRAWIERDAFMRPLRLVLIPPDRCDTIIVNGDKWHIADLVVNEETGERKRYKILDRDVLHIIGHSPDGICGYDVLTLARESIGLGLATEKQQATHFGRNAIPGLLLTVPENSPKLKKEGEAKAFLKTFRDMHEGLDNRGKTALLRHGVTATQLSHTGRDSQAIETRQFQREDVALWFCLETILGDESNSYKSHEQRQIAYLQGLPGKLMKRYEEQKDAKLLTERQKDRDSHFHSLNPGSLLRADMQTTMTTLRHGVESTIYSRNDARDYLGLDAVDGGDEYINPNTTSGDHSPSDPSPDDDNDDPDNDDVSAETQLRLRLQAAYQVRLQNLFDVEAKRIRAAAAKPERFASWVENFYGENEFPKTFASVWSELGGEPKQARDIMDCHRILVRDAEPSALESVLNELAKHPKELAEVLAK